MHSASCNIHLTSEDGLERLFTILLTPLVDISTIVRELLYTEHHAMICYRHTLHSISDSLINKPCHLRLTIEDGVISMYM